MLEVPEDALAQLAALAAAPKFGEEADTIYTGVHDLEERKAAETVINAAIRDVAAILNAGPAKAAVLGVFRGALERIKLTDTEDRERAASYIEQIMDCIGLESSEGLLNDWMYGLDPE